ncbi:hypothetical protein F3Y22_tig00110365pilonHSYRG00123 [Hibiscus syriacus]|uniref:Integrase catalytic domain-containing protein n=1 Tax=Hibiscus syriacus TaxID=106335 RepID=A0A6A3AYF0_HIBSY|nr:hypothetical protein F3Y22_tig00110365pilonHSYRG00123 [Hibiscus syriacus]
MAVDEENVKIEKFDGANFGFWKMQIKDFIQALGVIRLTLSRNVAFNIAKENITTGFMMALSSMYEKPSASNKSSLDKAIIQFADGGIGINSWNATVTTFSSSSGNIKLKFKDVRDLGHLSTPPHAKKSWRTMSVTTWKLKGVRHIPGLKRNLIYVGQLDGEGYSTKFSSCEWNITKGILVIARGKKTGTLYVTSNLENIIAVADANGKSNLWHQRLGHMSEKGMNTLLSKGKLLDLKNIDVGLCKDYIFGKQKKGPSPVPYLAGSLYYVTFIDDSTRKVWVYFLKKKSEVFDNFRKYKVMVENETSLKVKRLRYDNREEYRNSRFKEFCSNNGIKMETTVSMTPQQNGVVEVMNMTLNERARSMRIHVGLPKFLWPEAINTAAYLINRGPSIPLDGGIPEEISPEAVQEELGTPELRRSSRIPKPTHHYSPSLHYLLLTDNGELECYDEAIKLSITSRFTGSKKITMGANATKQDWLSKRIYILSNLDVKTVFLHGDLEEEIYMRQPEGLIEVDKKNLVCRLNKSLYSLKQAPRQWYKKFDSFMSISGFTKYQADHYCYIKKFDNNFIILLLYVDDMLVAGSYMQEIINLKKKLSKQFAMKDLGAAKQIIGMRIKRDTKSGTLMLSQAEYINKVFSRFNMQDVKSWELLAGGDTILTGYIDVDLAGNVEITRSNTRYVYTLGGTAVSWVSQLQKIVTLSTTEAEYVAVTEANKEMVWLQSFLEDDFNTTNPFLGHSDRFRRHTIILQLNFGSIYRRILLVFDRPFVSNSLCCLDEPDLIKVLKPRVDELWLFGEASCTSLSSFPIFGKMKLRRSNSSCLLNERDWFTFTSFDSAWFERMFPNCILFTTWLTGSNESTQMYPMFLSNAICPISIDSIDQTASAISFLVSIRDARATGLLIAATSRAFAASSVSAIKSLHCSLCSYVLQHLELGTGHRILVKWFISSSYPYPLDWANSLTSRKIDYIASVPFQRALFGLCTSCWLPLLFSFSPRWNAMKFSQPGENSRGIPIQKITRNETPAFRCKAIKSMKRHRNNTIRICL